MGRQESLEQVREQARHCQNCPLWQDATQTVFGAGPVQAGIMLVGEQPGDQEDRRGAPFVGPAGRIMDRALAEIGVAREQLYVTNAVKHFKYQLRGKRRLHKTPAQKEMEACRGWLEAELALIEPEVVVALGATAAKSLLRRAVPVLANRGQWFETDAGYRVLLTVHSSSLLRAPGDQREIAYRQFVADLQSLRDFV